MVMCFAPDCKHYSERDRCRFFVFPSDEVERKRWIALLRREDKQPSRYSLVCSCHFIDKDRNNGPTLFEHNKTKRLSDLSSASEPKAKKSKFTSRRSKFKLSTPQFTPQQVVQTRSIARARIHVERAIRRIKCYKILSLIPPNLVPHASFIYQVCGALTNFQYPLIREVEESFSIEENN